MSRFIGRRAVLGGGIGVAASGLLAFADPVAQASYEPSEVAGSIASAAVDEATADLMSVVAMPSRFAGIDPSAVSDSSAGLQAAINATPEGGTLVIPAGRYLVGTSIYPKLGKSIRIQAYGAVLIQNSSSPVLSLTGAYDQTFNVTAMSTSTPVGVSVPITKLSLSASSGWAPGDVVKICSDDVIDGARPGSDGLESRRGEFFVVRSVNGMTVYANGPLRESYATNVRVARISRQTFRLEGGEFQAAPTRVGQKNGAIILLSQLFAPTITRVFVSRASGPAFQMISCFGYSVIDCEVGRAIDDSSAGIFGYGVLDNSSSYGQVRGGLYRHVRHAFTDDTDRVAANSKLAGYGRTFAATIVGVQAVMTTNSSFDTHHSSEGTHFIGCTATSGGNQGQGQAGFQLRGRRHRITDCGAFGTDTGLQVINEAAGGESREHVVSGLTVHDTRGPAVRVQIHPAGHPEAARRDPFQAALISELTARRTNGFVFAYNADVELVNSHYQAPVGVDGQTVAGVYAENSIVRVRSTVLDFTANSAGIPRPISSGAPSGAIPGVQETEVSSVEIRANANVVARTFGAVNGSQHVFRARALRFTYPFKFMPGENLHAKSEYEWYCDRMDDNPTGRSSADFTLSNTDWQQQLERMPLSLDLALFARLTTTNNWTATSLPPGRRPGQTLTISHQGVNSWTLPSGPDARTKLRDGADRRLVNGDMIRLTWDGLLWAE